MMVYPYINYHTKQMDMERTISFAFRSPGTSVCYVLYLVH